MEAGLYTIFQCNGKDLFLQSVLNEDHFEVFSRQEIPQSFWERIEVGREVRITLDGTLIPLPTPREIEAKRREKLKAAIRERIEALKQEVVDKQSGLTRFERERLKAEKKVEDDRLRAVRKAQVICSIDRLENADGSSLDPWAYTKLVLLKEELQSYE